VGNTALMVASADGRTDIVKFLVLKGADIDLKNKVTNTLHIILLHSYIHILYYFTINKCVRYI
jgi:ankyrin repeat protein